MPENFSFRSSMNGFNRSDVITYIDALIQEKQNSELAVSAMEKEIAELKSENATLRALLTETNNSDKDKCADCDISKVYEARLGAAMLDAKRFSEILVKEANDKASDLFADALAAVESTSVKASAISRDIADFNDQFNLSFKILFDNINSLREKLDGFKNEVEATGGMFNFTTHFDDTASDDGDEAVKSDIITTDILTNKSKFADSKADKSNVNFDDADEYDFMVDVND